jgi:hypothetical protein
MTDYATVLTYRYSDRTWTLNGDDYAGLQMTDGGDKPSKKALDDAWSDVQAKIAAESAARVAARQSALAKLAALGLNDDEIAALVGA